MSSVFGKPAAFAKLCSLTVVDEVCKFDDAQGEATAGKIVGSNHFGRDVALVFDVDALQPDNSVLSQKQ